MNVLMAMEIISKEKKEIRWKGLPTNAQHDLEGLEQERQRLEQSIKRKREQLEQLIEQQVTYSNLVKRNSEEEERAKSGAAMPHDIAESDTRIPLPFIVVNTKADTVIKCEMTENRDEVMFKFTDKFEINDDSEILKRLGLHQAYPQELDTIFQSRKTVLSHLPDSVKKEPGSA